MMPTGSRVERAAPTNSVAVVVLAGLVARHERHVAVDDRRRVEGRGHDGEIDREGDDEDADAQDEIGDEIAEAAGSRPSVLHLALDVAELDRR